MMGNNLPHTSLCWHLLVIFFKASYIVLKARQLDFFIFLSGVRSLKLEYILDYIYVGEVQLYPEQLNSFLDVAQKLRIKGLIGNDEKSKSTVSEKEFIPEETVYQNQFINIAKNEENIENTDKSIVRSNNSGNRKQRLESNSFVFQSDINVKESVKNIISQDGEKWICNDCGKEARTKGNIELHAEIHIRGLTFHCDKCDKTFRSRNVLSNHRTKYH